MTGQGSRDSKKTGRGSYFWLAIGVIFLLFANGRWVIPLATWLTWVFILRFVRTQKPVRGLILAALAGIVGSIFGWWGVVKWPVYVLLIRSVIVGLIFVLPFLADRLISPRLNGIFSTLVFPLVFTIIGYLFSFNPSAGTFGALAYTQYGNLPLVQVVSVTGIWGLAFLITWFASVVNSAWQEDFKWERIRGVVHLYAAILALVLFFGGARLAFFPPDADTVRVASITTPGIGPELRLRESGRLPPFEKTIELLDSLTRQAALAGAKIVFWQEYAALVPNVHYAAFIDRGRDLARQCKIYLMLGIGVFGSGQRGENKAVLIAPSGKVEREYLKHHLVPMLESPYVVKGRTQIPILDTPFGRISSVICFDADWPNFVRQAAKAGADLLLVPSLDWKEIAPLHTHMATFRALENGFSMIRCTGRGLSIAVDHQGRCLASADYFTATNSVMISDVPIRAVHTIYSKVGDLFAWLCIAGFLMLIGRIFLKHKAVRKVSHNGYPNQVVST